MSDASLSPGVALALDELRARGCRVIGPGAMTPGATSPTAGAATELPGMHVQIADGHRLIEGFGATADEAVEDALVKLEGYDPDGLVTG